MTNETTQRTYTKAEVDSIVEKAIEAERARVLVMPSDEEILELGKDYAKKYNHPVLNKHSYEIDATAFAAGHKAALSNQRTISEDVLMDAINCYAQALRQWDHYMDDAYYDIEEEASIERQEIEDCKQALKALRDAFGGE